MRNDISGSTCPEAGKANVVISCTSDEVEEESIGTAEDSNLGSSEQELDEDPKEEAWGRGLRGAKYLNQSTIHSGNMAGVETRLQARKLIMRAGCRDGVEDEEIFALMEDPDLDSNCSEKDLVVGYQEQWEKGSNTGWEVPN